jgi:dihydrofolate synthase/folylpolyglutamate synthase
MKIYELYKNREFDIKVGLDRIKEALDYLGNPERAFKSVLISGTNGKGSTSAFLESLLRHHNLKTGLYTSPHLIRENERFQINRNEISDEELSNYVKLIEQIIDKFQLSYFEAITLTAFLYFKDNNVDIAVLEVGLGGRWDATNVVYPEVSVITNVSLDHTHILGDTIEKIAFEKLGITRKDRPLVIGRKQDEIIKQALDLGIKDIYYPPDNYQYRYYLKDELTTIDYKFPKFDVNIKNIQSRLLGKRQAENIATALTTFLLLMNRLNRSYKTELIKEAIFNTSWKGRMEILSQKPLTIIDGAHNFDAIQQSIREIKELFPEKKIYLIYSSMKDKNWKEYIEFLKKETKNISFVEIPIERGLKSSELMYNFPDIRTFNSFNDAYSFISKEIDKDSLILILGSLYFIGDVLKNFKTI